VLDKRSVESVEEGSEQMQVVHERCAGIDVHKRTVVVTVLVGDAPGIKAGMRNETRTFGTMTADLLAWESGWRASG
jgi:hypothetical protein